VNARAQAALGIVRDPGAKPKATEPQIVAPSLPELTPVPKRRARQSRLPGVRAQPIVKAGPVVKSAGGKTRLLPILRSHLPLTFEKYLEPFVGGGALFFDLARPGSILGDLNFDLIDTYASLAFDVEAVIRSLENLASRYRKDPRAHYYATRDLWNDPECEATAAERAAMFIYLSKTCFNGLHRVNKAGKFNVPIGRYENPTICDSDRLRAAASLLATAKLWAGDFATVCAMATRGDLVYLDSPYDGGSFVAYTSAGGGVELQERIAIVAHELAERGVHVLASNHDTPLVRELYLPARGWHVAEILAPRSVAANGGKRGKARELLIASYPFPTEAN
jgi:DNA adenine methylase